MAKKSDLENFYPAPVVVKTSIGDITVSRFKLKQLSQAGEVIARLMSCIQFDSLENLSKSLKIDAQWLGQALFGRGMESLQILMELGTGRTWEELGELEIDEAMAVAETVTEICIIPSVKSAGKSLEKLKGGLNPGATSSTASPPEASAPPRPES